MRLKIITPVRAARLALMLALLPSFAQAAVSGFCERDGTRLTFTDGIAFQDARDATGTVTTTVYLTAKPLDRNALKACPDCRATLPEEVFASPRGDFIEKQKSAVNDGWVELAHVGGELNMSTLVNIMHLSKDGVLTGITGSNSDGSLQFSKLTDTQVIGTIKTVPTDPAYFDGTDMTCDVRFELPVAWPK